MEVKMANLEVRKGLLPIKLDTGKDGREIERAKLFLQSLRHAWVGERPFELHIVGQDDQLTDIANSLLPYNCDAIFLSIHAESEFFSKESSFFHIKGMYKQQLIKLWVSSKLDLGAFITFDCDIVCLRHFSEETFVYQDKLISQWESRRIHSWWENSMIGLRVWGDQDLPGLAVTPNVLHTKICSDVFSYLEARGFDPIEHLCWLTEHHPKIRTLERESLPLAWSEYSLYTLVGEWFSDLERFHLSSAQVSDLGISLFSRRNVWNDQETHRLIPDKGDAGFFLVVSSWSGVPADEIPFLIGLELDRA